MTAQQPIKRFYVYTLADVDVVFYVGKGTKRRIDQHEIEADKGYGIGKDRQYMCHCRKCCAIRQIWDAGRDVVRKIVFETNDERRAFNYETATIAKHTSSALCNVTHGPSEPTRTSRRFATVHREIDRRDDGSGSVYQNQAGRWCASVRYIDSSTGQQRRKKFEGKDRDLVVNKLANFIEQK